MAVAAERIVRKLFVWWNPHISINEKWTDRKYSKGTGANLEPHS